jgi:PAS domain S-box-containing protein
MPAYCSTCLSMIVDGQYALVATGSHALIASMGIGLGWLAFRTSCVSFSPVLIGSLIGLSAIGAGALTYIWAVDGTGARINLAVLAMGSTAITALVAAGALKSARTLRDLKAFQERMKIASDVARIGTWDWKIANDSCHWDAGMHALYGTSPQDTEMTSLKFMNLVHPEDRHRLHRNHEVFALGGAPQRDEFRIIRTDGAVRTIRTALHNVHDEKGRLVRVTGLHMDVTDLRTAEARRGQAENQLHSVVGTVPGAVLTYRVNNGGNGITTFLNRYCENLLEIDEETVREDHTALFRLVEKQDLPGLSSAVKSAFRTNGPFVHRWRMNLPSGKQIWVEGRGARHDAPDGVAEICAFLIDITEMVDTQAELVKQRERAARAERLESIGKLSGGIAHDFNNLLAVIVGNLEILREELSGDEKKLTYVREGLEASVRGADLVRNMLTFARRARLEPTCHSVTDLLDRVQSWVSRVLPATIDVKIEVPDGTWSVRADASGAENALVNLILNARDAMATGGKLAISARNETVPFPGPGHHIEGTESGLSPGRYVVIDVTDTGHGIAPEDSERVFEPFFTTRQPGRTSGSGLGLSTVHGFMEQTGGTVLITSQPEAGTRISLYFPADQTEENLKAANAQHDPSQANRPTKRILLTEDEAQVAKVLMRALQMDGHEVVAAACGDEAAILFQDNGPFDLLVTDVVMPGQLQGPELAEVLRQKDPDLPVVFLSGYAPDTMQPNKGIRQTDLCLMKPVIRADLLGAITRAMSTRHRQPMDLASINSPTPPAATDGAAETALRQQAISG